MRRTGEESHPVETYEKSNVKIESYEKIVSHKINVLVKKINEKSKRIVTMLMETIKNVYL